MSLKYQGVSPRHAGVAIYENGVRRMAMTAGHTGSNVIEFSTSDPSRLYGYNTEGESVPTDDGRRRGRGDPRLHVPPLGGLVW